MNNKTAKTNTSDSKQGIKRDDNIKIIRNIPLKDIEENPLNEEIFNMDDIKQLAETIKEEGFSGSIEVIEIGKNKYQIYSGHRRYRAVKSLGWDSIPCTIENNLNDTTLIKRLLSSNIQTRKMRPMDYANAIKVYDSEVLSKENFKGDKRAEKARFFGMSKSQIRRFEILSKLIPELQAFTEDPSFPYVALVEAETLTVKQQQELATIINIDLSKYQDEFGISAQMVKSCINSVKLREERRKEAEAQALIREKLFEQEDFEELENEDDKSFSFFDTLNTNVEDVSDMLPAATEPDLPPEYIPSEEPEIPHKLTREEKKIQQNKLLSSIDIDISQIAISLKETTDKDFDIYNTESVRQAIDEIKIYIKKIEEKLNI